MDNLIQYWWFKFFTCNGKLKEDEVQSGNICLSPVSMYLSSVHWLSNLHFATYCKSWKPYKRNTKQFVLTRTVNLTAYLTMSITATDVLSRTQSPLKSWQRLSLSRNSLLIWKQKVHYRV